MSKEKQEELDLLNKTIEGFETINKVICDVEFTLPQPTWGKEEISTPEFIRQRLYGLRAELGNIHYYAKREKDKLQEELYVNES